MKKKKQPDDLLIQVFKEILLVDGHPRLIVLVGNGFLEVLVNALVREKLKNGNRIHNDRRTFTYAVRILMLHEVGVITDQEFKALDWYKDIRNRAAHEPIFTLSNSDFDVLGNPSYSTTDNLLKLTTDLIGSIWNSNIELFSPLFSAIRPKL